MKLFFFMNLCFLALDAAVFFHCKKEPAPAPVIQFPPQMPPVIPQVDEVEEVAPIMTEEEADQKLVSFIKQKEGFHSRPYICPAGELTIGYGFTGKLAKRKSMTEKEATRILVEEIIPAEKRKVESIVRVPLTPYQKAALVSFVYNCGEENLSRLVNGKNRLNGGNYERTAALLMLYTKADGKTLRGLVERRKQEAALFLGKM
jgi:lysozyme